MRIQFIFTAFALPLGAVLSALQLSSCSALQVNAPAPTQLAVPENPAGSGFNLSGESPQGVFRGGLLFWSPDVSSEQIRTLLKATREANQKYVDLQRYFSDFTRNEIEPMRAQVAELREQYAISKLQSNARIAPLQAKKAALWYDSEMDTIQSEFSDFNRGRANAVFHAYCEAKILDLATRPVLARSRFLARPTPSAVCESYYKNRFFDGPECEASAQGKNYYSCIWNEGVLRTSLASRLQIRVAERKSGVRISQPLTLGEFSRIDSIRNALAHEDVPFCAATEVRRNILSGVRFRVLSSGVILGGLSCGENSRFEISYGPGDWTTDLERASSAVIVGAIESQAGAGGLPDPFRWIEVAAAERNPQLAERLDKFARKMSLFHSPVSGCDSELNSANDVFFNDGRMVAGQSVQGSCKDRLPSLVDLPDVVVTDAQLEKERIELARLEMDLKSLKGNNCTVVPSCERVPKGHARCDFLNAKVRKAAAAEAKGVADILVTDFALSFERVSTATSIVVLSMNGAAVAVGCVGEVQSGHCMEALSRPELASAKPMLAEVTSAGELSLGLEVDIKQMLASGVPPSVVAQFQPFERSTLELSVTSNSFERLVPYLSGKAYLTARGSGERLAEGSVSYLLETTFDRNLGEFCSAQ